MKLFIEACLVGIIIIFFGYIGSLIAKTILPKPKNNEYFNKYHVMELSLFIAGFLTHIIFQFIGFNKWYCKHGLACIKHKSIV